MANTKIQLRRSTVTATPTDGSLSVAEPAYSFSSDKLFLGNTSGTGVIEIGGRFYINVSTWGASQANVARDHANAAHLTANAGFNQANTARDHANAAHLTANAGFTQANTARTHANTAYEQANTARTHANTAHLTANAAFDQANTARTHANNAYNRANNSLSTSGGSVVGDVTITGELSVTGNLILSGNTIFANVETLRISDPLLYLAGNNYSSDIVDIGFVANYNDGSANLHTGVFRDATAKEYYIFQGYNKEPEPNHIDTTANGFTLAVLNADIRTSNLNLGGVNAISWLRSSYDQANTARTHANTAHLTANAAFDQANTARTHANTAHLTANAAYDQANTARTHANTAHLTANAAFDKANSANVLAYNIGIGANGWTNTVFGFSNTYTQTVGAASNGWANTVASASAVAANTNAANGSYISAGIVKVAYGGTGMVSFTSNGVLYGNSTGDLKVTAAGTEGQVLQASDAGVPVFGMLDGGTF